MPRICQLTGRKTIFGHRVSHANNKSSRKFKVNLHTLSFYHKDLKDTIKLRVSSKALKMINKKGIEHFIRLGDINNGEKER